MMTKTFWVVITVLLAIVVHVSYVLFTPRWEMRGRMNRLADGRINSFRVYPGDDLPALTRRPLKYMLYGGCVIEPGDGAVEMMARIPRAYWSVTVYSPAGDVVYTLNDRHADVDKLAIVFRKKQDAADGGIQAPRLRAGKLIVPLDDSRVLAVVQAYVRHPGMRQRIMEQLKASSCRALSGAPAKSPA